MFKKTKLLCCLTMLLYHSPAPASHGEGSILTTWRKINSAFQSDDINSLKVLSNSKNPFVAYLSKATMARSSLDFENAKSILSKCMLTKARHGFEKYLQLSCIVSYAVIEGELGNVKSLHYYNDNIRCNYINENKVDLKKYLGNLIVINSINECLLSQKVEHWPDTTIRITSGWKKIETPDGYVQALLANRPVKFMVDTGVSNIILSRETATRLNILSKMIDLHVTEHLLDGGSGKDGQLYVAPSLELGPLEFKNVYIVVASDTTNAIGINLLSKLGSFELKANSIVNASPPTAGDCSPMRLYQQDLFNPVNDIIVPLHTSAGNLNLRLDTGYRTNGNMPPVMLFIFSKKYKLMKDKFNVRPYHTGLSSSSQNGRILVGESAYFTLQIPGSHAPLALGTNDFSWNHSQDNIHGTIGYNFLIDRSLFLDFSDNNRQVCVYDN